MPIFVGPGITVGGGISITQFQTPPAALLNTTTLTQSPFAGGGDAYSFTGNTNSYLWYPGSSGLAFGNGNYTVEWFQYQTASANFPRPFWYSAGGGGSPYLGLSFEGFTTTANVYLWPNITTLATLTISTYLNKWTHFALVRINSRVFLYQDGVLQNAGGTPDNTQIVNTTGYWFIGGKGTTGTTGEYFPGYMTNFRVCKGVGVYTGNFTVPTTPLQYTQTAGTNISAITAGQCTLLMAP